MYYPNMFQAPRMEIVTVNGRNGANAYPMPPNSGALLLDEAESILWVCKTDGAGYKTVVPFNISPFEQKPQITLEDIMARLIALEKRMEGVKDESCITDVKQSADDK